MDKKAGMEEGHGWPEGVSAGARRESVTVGGPSSPSLNPNAELPLRCSEVNDDGTVWAEIEKDPSGLDPHTPGAKLDDGKLMAATVLFGFSRALEEVTKVGTHGIAKYSVNGWMKVQDGITRYGNARIRHALKEARGEMFDRDSGLLHAAHEAWNALARLELMLIRMGDRD